MEERGSKVLKLAKKLAYELRPYCKRIEIVGSIRRKVKNPEDIDIVLIPKNREKLEKFMRKRGKFFQGGDKKSFWKIDGIEVEFYYTNEEEFGAAILAYSGKTGSNIGLRIIARTKGFKLTQHGLFNRKTGKRIAGKTEREIYEKLGRPYKSPEKR